MIEGNMKLPTDGKFSTLIYGPSGSGKTHFCTTMPKPYLICTERVPQGLKACGKDIPYVKVETYEELEQVLNEIIMHGAHRAVGAESICLDSLSDMTPLVIEMLLRKHAKTRMTLELWGIAVDHLRTYIRRFVTEVTKQAYVCVTSLAATDKDEITGEIIGRPETIGRFANQVSAMFDVCLFAKQEAAWNATLNRSEPTWQVSTVANGRFPAKDGIGFLAPTEPNEFDKMLVKLKAKKATFAHLVGGVL
jgi:hypothetical protein